MNSLILKIVFILTKYLLRESKCQLDGLDEIEQYIQQKKYQDTNDNSETDYDQYSQYNNDKTITEENEQQNEQIIKCDYSNIQFLKNVNYTVSQQGIIEITNFVDLNFSDPIDLSQIECPSFRMRFSNMYYLTINSIFAQNQAFEGIYQSNRRTFQSMFSFTNISKVYIDKTNFTDITINNLVLFEIDKDVQFFSLKDTQMRYISTNQPLLVSRKFDKIKIENILLQNIKQNNHMKIFEVNSGSSIELVEIQLQGRQDVSVEGFFYFQDVKNVKIYDIKIENVFVVMSKEYDSNMGEIGDFPAVFRFHGISYIKISKFYIQECKIFQSFLMININPITQYDLLQPKGINGKNNIEFENLQFDDIQIDYDKQYIEEIKYQRKSQIYHGFINVMSKDYDTSQETLIDLKMINSTFNNIRKTSMNDNDVGGILNIMNYKNIQINNITISNCNSPNSIIKVMRGDILVIKDSKFFYNSVASQGGGVIHIKISNNIIIRQTKFIQNNSTEGGAIHGEFISYFKVQECEFSENQALQGNGGAINIVHIKSIYIKSTLFENNRSVKSGGSLFIKSSLNFGCIALSNITAINEKQVGQVSAQYGGFGMFIQTHTLIINDTLISGYNSEITGGGLYISEIYNVTLSDVEISDCQSQQYAGAAFLHQIGLFNDKSHPATLIMSIKDCSSFIGAGLYIEIDENYKLNLSKVIFERNYAHIQGDNYILNFQNLVVVNIQEQNSNILAKKNINFENVKQDMSIKLSNFRSGSKVLFEFYLYARQIDNDFIYTDEMYNYSNNEQDQYQLEDHIKKLQEERSKLEKDLSEEVFYKIKNRDLSSFLTVLKEDDQDVSHYVSLLSEFDMYSKHYTYASYFIKQLLNFKLNYNFLYKNKQNDVLLDLFQKDLFFFDFYKSNEIIFTHFFNKLRIQSIIVVFKEQIEANYKYIYKLIFYKKRGNQLKKLKYSFQLRTPFYQNQAYDQSYKTVVDIDFRECIEGEVHMNYQAQICYQCPFSTFSFEKPTNNTYCKNKLFQFNFKYFIKPNGVNTSYGNYWDLEKGYWRSELRPDILIECSNLKDNCKGGDQYGNNLCSEGHIGPLCEECDIGKEYWHESYAKIGLYSCTKCKDIQNNKFVLVGVFTATFAFLIIILFSTYKKVTNTIYRYYLIKMKLCYIGSSYYKMTLSTAYLKIFLNFLQTIQMSQLIRFKNLRDILFVTNIVGQPLQTVFFSIDCWLSELVQNKKSLTEVKILLVILAPLIFILTVGALSLLVYKYKKGINLNKIKYITTTVIIYGLINIFSINCFRILVNALFCRQIGDQLFLKIDLTLQCDNNQELASKQLFLYLPACLLWSFLIPSLIFYGLFKQRLHLNKISTRYMYGFLYNEYKNNYYFWDFIRMGKNILLVIIANQYQNNRIWIFSLLAIVISQLYTICLLLIRPFNTAHLNRSEIQSSVLSSITFFACLMMSLQESIHSPPYFSYDDGNSTLRSLTEDDNLVYYIGLFVTLLICIFSIKTLFNIFISFFERRLVFKQIMALLFKRPITFNRFVNIQKLRNLLDGIIQFSKTENREKYDQSLKTFMHKYKEIGKQNYKHMIQNEEDKKIFEKSRFMLNNLFKQKSQETIELSENVNGINTNHMNKYLNPINKFPINNKNNDLNIDCSSNSQTELQQTPKKAKNKSSISFNPYPQNLLSPTKEDQLQTKLIDDQDNHVEE